LPIDVLSLGFLILYASFIPFVLHVLPISSLLITPLISGEQ
jgi:hypothetical protein